MNLLYTAVGGFHTVESEACRRIWKEGFHILGEMPLERIPAYLKFDIGSAYGLVDAIVCMADMGSIAWSSYEVARAIGNPFEKALAVARDVGELPATCTMRDGRKWRSVPFIIFCDTYHSVTGIPIPENVRVCLHSFDPFSALQQVEQIVSAYHDRVLAGYERLGFLVRFEYGHAQIGPALKRKDAENDYYHSVGDRRNNKGWLTVRRDREGLERDILLFQELLDNGANETEMHRFFEEHPAILMEARSGIPLSHPLSFSLPKRHTMDFAFSPILGPGLDNAISLLEMKGPADETLVRQRFHPGLSAKIYHAIEQLKDYDRNLRDPANLDAIKRAFGYVPQNSDLAVLIGRSPNKLDEEHWNYRRGQLDVELVTYDQILEMQVRQLERPKPYTLLSGTERYPI